MRQRPDLVAFVGSVCNWCDQRVTSSTALSLVRDRGSERWRPYHLWCVEEEAEKDMDRLLRGQ
jgi:hypothetical protein